MQVSSFRVAVPSEWAECVSGVCESESISTDDVRMLTFVVLGYKIFENVHSTT